MKHFFVIVLLGVFASYSFGQKPSASPSPEPEKNRMKDFGSSLKKYDKEEKRDRSAKQIKRNANEDEIIRLDTDLVVSDVLVTDQKGNIITGLKKEDLVVLEDGLPQAIEMFSMGENATLPRSIVLIVSYAPPQAPYLKTSIAAATLLVDKLAPQDEMAIVTADLKLRLDFTKDKDLLTSSLNSLEKEDPWRGWKVDFDALLAVLNEMFDEKDRQRVVIFQGDGNHAIWLKPDKEHPYPVSYSTLYKSGMKWTGARSLSKFGFSEVREAIERSRATIYSVIPGIKFLGLSKEEQLARAKITLTDSSRFFGWKNVSAVIKEYQFAEAERKTAGQAAMLKVAELSGGFAGFVEKPEDAENIYSEIFTVIKNRYVIGYYPTNQNRDGKRREVKIEVRGHPEYIVTGRKAYFH